MFLMGALGMLLRFFHKVHPVVQTSNNTPLQSKAPSSLLRKSSSTTKVESDANKKRQPQSQGSILLNEKISEQQRMDLLQKINVEFRNQTELQVTREDGLYLVSQLTYEGIAIKDSYLKWKGKDQSYELRTGEVPQFVSVNGSFDDYNFEDLKEELTQNNEGLEEIKEVRKEWQNIDQSLSPFAILLVKGKKADHQSYFFEYWNYDVQKKKVLRKIPAGRR